MSILCPACTRTNPANASYCYYDGRNLAHGRADGPMRIGVLPFPTPFYFADGFVCTHFNQLALACDERWAEAGKLLGEGVWATFFSGIGRLDLAAAAKLAAAEPNRDVGLSQLLERFPADVDVLRPPKLAVDPAKEDFASLVPGKNQSFELRISNRGMLVLRGMVQTDCDWLAFGEPGSNVKLMMFQTRNIYCLPVRVLGNRLRAGQKAIEGKIVIDSSGGVIEVPVRAKVPILPFPTDKYPNNVLAGAKSPHELAKLARAHLDSASVLFEQGAVKAWYESNGWIYPVQGTTSMGKGSVQQYFEAMGLVKPPVLECDVERWTCEGAVGEKLMKRVTISTKESRHVYAEARGSQDWIKAGPANAHGKCAVIPLEIKVPDQPGKTLEAEVSIQGNGRQQFTVPVRLEVTAATPADDDGAKRMPWMVLLGGMAAVVLAAAGAYWMIAGNPAQPPTPGNPPIIAIGPGENPPKLPNNENPPPVKAWWDGTTLGASAQLAKQKLPGEEATIDALLADGYAEREGGYDRFANKLPQLLSVAPAWEPLRQLVVDCFRSETSDLNVIALSRGLAKLLPLDDSEFLPERKGLEVEQAQWTLQTTFGLLAQKGLSPQRPQGLVHEMERVLGFSIVAGAQPEPIQPEQLQAQAEKIVAMRHYRGLLATAKKSLDHALTMRDTMANHYAKALSPDFRHGVDLQLVAIAMQDGDAPWPRLEPILAACLESEDLGIGLRVLEVYEKSQPPFTAQMDRLLSSKWKAAGNAKLTHAKKLAAIRRELVGDANGVKITPADRVARLQKLTNDALAPIKNAGKNDTALLQDTIRLAHASTMATTLFHKDAEVERFDALADRPPDIEPMKAEVKKEPEPKEAKGDKFTPPVGGVIPVIAQITRQGMLKAGGPKDARGCYTDLHLLSIKAGIVCNIDHISNAFDAYLRLEGPNQSIVTENDDGGGDKNARITFRAPVDGIYKLYATTQTPGKTGAYALIIAPVVNNPFIITGFGGFGIFGARMFPPGVVPNGEPPVEGPKAEPKKPKNPNASDLADLEKPQVATRLAAFRNLADNASSDMPARDAQRIARYLTFKLDPKGELDEAREHFAAFARCRPLLLALATAIGKEDANQKASVAAVAGVLRAPFLFTADEDWRSQCRKMLLTRALEMTASANGPAEKAADFLRDLYKEQCLAIGIEEAAFQKQERASEVLESLIQHVAALTKMHKLSAEDDAFLQQMPQRMRAYRFAADNDLERVVLLQREWMRILTLYLGEQVPAAAAKMRAEAQTLVQQDRQAGSVLDQLRGGEERLLRIWALAHDLK